MERRDLLRALASATALSLIPNSQAFAAWTRAAAGPTAGLPNGLNDAQMALVKAMADTIIPRTDSPSATDVGVERFIDVMVAEYATDDDRTKFLAALDAIDARAKSESNATFADLSPEARGKLIESLESGPRDADPAQQYWRLKGLIVHGYFTSETVMKDVLKVQVMPGRFDGAAPVTIRKKPVQAGTPKPEDHFHG
ncbi:MAG TPA: gluconate 2-dehydrogenase subunit 3 family protein [Gemmatimonadaceae bacterium]|nr:gluconate 2-dehydrogenase subunit 3 family protein [Gemmatimonadaceae bacterium]